MMIQSVMKITILTLFRMGIFGAAHVTSAFFHRKSANLLYQEIRI